MPGFDNYYGNDANNARMREEAERQRQQEQRMREDSRRGAEAQMAWINDLTRRDKFIPEPDYSRMAVGAASGFMFAWGIKQIFRGLFGGGR